jgi:AcrR family transcriptional regulator
MRNYSAADARVIGRRSAGRRSGDNTTRASVLAAARRQFSELGYDRTTLRSVAAEAGVDQKLVGYFHGSKHALFVAATALPFDPAEGIASVLTGDPEGRGERLANLIVSLLENPEVGDRLIGLVRAAAAEPEAGRLVRELLTAEVWKPAAVSLLGANPGLAVSLVAVQLLGLVMARYVVGAEPLASLPPEGVIELLAPILQRLLSGRPPRENPDER